MTTIPLGITHYSRTVGHTPVITLKNLFVEKDPANAVDGLVRLQRPGLAPLVVLGANPIRGHFRQAGTFNGDQLALSGTALYRVTTAGVATSLGTVAGTDRVIIAASATRALIATGTTCYSTDGVTVTTVTMPAGENVSSVAYINGYFILTVADSQEFFWIIPGGTNPDALDFAAAENAPDNLVAVKRLYDELWFFGESTVEVWQTTGNSDAPFERIAGRLYEKGCANKHSIAVTDNTLFWVGGDMIAYRGDNQPVRISDHSVEEVLRLNGSGEIGAWAFALDGHTFYCLTIGSRITQVYDVESANWPAWESYGRSVWRAHVGVQIGATVVAGDDTTGTLWLLNTARSNDNGDPMIREIGGFVPAQGPQATHCDNVSIFVATGFAPLTGDASEAVLEFNYSDDGGQTYPGPEMELSLGLTGEYGMELVQRQLGIIKPPGRLFRWRMSEDTVLRVSYARYNEA